VASQLLVQHGLEERPEGQAVVGGHEVDRRSHHHGPDHLPVEQELAQLLRPEPFEPRPQPDVRVQRDLRLHADQVADGPEHGESPPIQQQLARQRRPVALPEAQQWDHRSSSSPIAARAGRSPW
jgi:hypothetical protein